MIHIWEGLVSEYVVGSSIKENQHDRDKKIYIMKKEGDKYMKRMIKMFEIGKRRLQSIFNERLLNYMCVF